MLKTIGVVALSLRLAAASVSFPGIYVESANIVGDAFFDAFNWQAIADPTHARVNLTDQATARALNLSYTSRDSFVMRMDATTVLDPAGPGRNSVRIMSKANYTTHVAVFDIRHMPEGCGTWPTIIEVAQDGALAKGKCDIVEGINNNGTNQATLHTTADCLVDEQDPHTSTGTTVSTNCDDVATASNGCGVHAPSNTPNFGPAFNAAGGGWYAYERAVNKTSVWFWSRSRAKTVPLDVRFPLGGVAPALWGKPFALWTNSKCDLAAHFGPNNIVFKNNICGDWAGVQDNYSGAGCPGTCLDLANAHPEAFAEAYWDVASLRIYEPSSL
ncbi:glycoside hydrolase family 16 protein [Auriculariales sp. MPI-PUGE-AT-0066]|nr:glycoside hydrolase family 16 protein [Auriculariales sp. MPI-PUGE-AT-0066]